MPYFRASGLRLLSFHSTDFFSSQCKRVGKFFSETNEVGWACSTYEGEESFIQGFGEKPDVKRPLGRPSPRSEANIKIDLKEVGWLTMGTGDVHL
jgi:hypothetical protein